MDLNLIEQSNDLHNVSDDDIEEGALPGKIQTSEIHYTIRN